jgi:hypothetical protein
MAAEVRRMALFLALTDEKSMKEQHAVELKADAVQSEWQADALSKNLVIGQ